MLFCTEVETFYNLQLLTFVLNVCKFHISVVNSMGGQHYSGEIKVVKATGGPYILANSAYFRQAGKIVG